MPGRYATQALCASLPVLMNGGLPLRAIALVVLALAVTLPVAAPADTRPPGFQLQADGLMFGPLGDVPSQNHVTLSSLFGKGGGFAITGTLGLKPHWLIGLRVASYKSTKEGDYSFDEIVAPPGQTYAAGSGPYTVRRELELLPVHLLLQYRHAIGPVLEWQAEGGAGVISTIDHMTLISRAGSGNLSSIPGYQRDPSWTVGTGIAIKLPQNLDMVGSARYCGTLSSDGAVWLKNDDPSFTNWSLGLRYPHDTR